MRAHVRYKMQFALSVNVVYGTTVVVSSSVPSAHHSSAKMISLNIKPLVRSSSLKTSSVSSINFLLGYKHEGAALVLP